MSTYSEKKSKMFKAHNYAIISHTINILCLFSGYKVVEKADLPGQFDYRCRTSLSGVGCTLSVFDQREDKELQDLGIIA